MNRLLRIAFRVAGAQVQLQGPFKKSSPDHEATVTCPVGFVGAFVPLLIEYWGGDPNDPELQAEAAQEGGELDVGYEVESEYYQPGYSSWTAHDPEEYELILKITHLAGYELSPADQAVIAKTKLDDILREQVEDQHLKDYKARAADAKAEARAEARADRDYDY